MITLLGDQAGFYALHFSQGAMRSGLLPYVRFFFFIFFLDMAICPDVDNYANDLGYFNFIIINSV